MRNTASLTVVQLKRELKTLGSKTSGNRAELVQRLEDLRNGVTPSKKVVDGEKKARRNSVRAFFDEEAQESNNSDVEEDGGKDEDSVSNIALNQEVDTYTCFIVILRHLTTHSTSKIIL